MASPALRQSLRRIPSISSILADPAIIPLLAEVQPELATKVAQRVVDGIRAALLAGDHSASVEEVVPAVAGELRLLLRPKLREVINGTGIVVHTNLGRAPVSDGAAAAMAEAAGHYTPLELELETGRRGGRMAEITRLMALLTGAEASLVVNNNAAAVLLVLSALCAGGEVVLSRSQAVEIGGGFRVPDVMAQSGAQLVEVGTTNRTYARDYEAAIGERTAALLAVHWSNFRIIGFTAQPSLDELAEVAHRHGLPLIEDLGSGALVDTAPYGLAHEPTIGESLTAGVDIVCASGDKLLGGPQAGIICGRRELVQRVAAHPLARAVRADKTALAGLAATLRHYLAGDHTATVPVWRMLAAPLDLLEARCRDWQSRIAEIVPARVVASQSAVGGGSLPGETLESRALAISDEEIAGHRLTLDEFARRLRAGLPPLMAHVEDGQLLIDARTVLPHQDAGVIAALRAALSADPRPQGG